MIDGKGDPNTSQEFKDGVEVLFGLSYKLKFMVKKSEMAIDYSVMPLEGLWWVDDMSQFTIDDKSDWKWTAMIMQPEFITLDMVNEAIEELRRKKDPVALSEIRFESYEEGKAAQIMHIGPYAAERRSLVKMERFAQENGYRYRGRHHEIYIGDPRRAKPENLRTVLRHPVEKVR